MTATPTGLGSAFFGCFVLNFEGVDLDLARLAFKARAQPNIADSNYGRHPSRESGIYNWLIHLVTCEHQFSGRVFSMPSSTAEVCTMLRTTYCGNSIPGIGADDRNSTPAATEPESPDSKGPTTFPHLNTCSPARNPNLILNHSHSSRSETETLV